VVSVLLMDKQETKALEFVYKCLRELPDLTLGIKMLLQVTQIWPELFEQLNGLPVGDVLKALINMYAGGMSPVNVETLKKKVHIKVEELLKV
jgi:hypothetical protein